MLRLLALLSLILSIGLFCSSILSLAYLAGDPTGSDWAGERIENLICEDGESLIMKQGPSMRNTTGSGYSRSTSYFCSRGDGIERDVTGKMVLLIIGSFVGQFLCSGVLFTLFILILTGKVIRGVSKVVQDSVNVSGSSNRRMVIDMRGGTASTPDSNPPDPEVARTLEKALGGLAGTLSQAAMLGNPQGNLSERLQQLEDARARGLITEAEYQRVRQALLDRMDDPV